MADRQQPLTDNKSLNDLLELRKQAARILGWAQQGSGLWHPPKCWEGRILRCWCGRGAGIEDVPTADELLGPAIDRIFDIAEFGTISIGRQEPRPRQRATGSCGVYRGGCTVLNALREPTWREAVLRALVQVKEEQHD